MDRIQVLQNQLTSESKIKIEVKGQIGYIIMNSQKDLNCLGYQMRTQILQAIVAFDQDENIKVMVITSNLPKVFCAGADIKELKCQNQETFMRKDIFHDMRHTLSNYKKPLIAAINGIALGGGCELALLSDIIVCSQQAQFALPEITLGVIPGLGGTQRMTKLIGRTNANFYIMTGEKFSSQRAYEMGLVSHVFENEIFLENVDRIAQKISSFSMYSLIAAKDSIRKAEEYGIKEGQEFERVTFTSLFGLKGSTEGINAFVEKRKPNFEKM